MGKGEGVLPRLFSFLADLKLAHLHFGLGSSCTGDPRMSEVEVSVVAMAVGGSLGLPVSQQKVIYVIRTFNSD